MWDYLNRMLASGYNNSTTTYAYDAAGERVLQTSTTSTTYYPASSSPSRSTTNGGTSWATSTNYIWLGDTLLATIDQKLYNGTATGTATTRYVHPDHLGSTNVVTDASGTGRATARLLPLRRHAASLPAPTPRTRSGSTSGNSPTPRRTSVISTQDIIAGAGTVLKSRPGIPRSWKSEPS